MILGKFYYFKKFVPQDKFSTYKSKQKNCKRIQFLFLWYQVICKLTKNLQISKHIITRRVTCVSTRFFGQRIYGQNLVVELLFSKKYVCYIKVMPSLQRFLLEVVIYILIKFTFLILCKTWGVQMGWTCPHLF